MSLIIFAHGDSDGICAGAIVKSALPGSSVFFTSPVGLIGELNSLTENHENGIGLYEVSRRLIWAKRSEAV